MISNVSFSQSKVSNVKEKTYSKFTLSPTQKAYADSFIRNAKEETPVLLGITGLLSLLEFGSPKKPAMSKCVKNNLTKFFVPVLIVSSALCAGIENKKPSKSSKL